MRVGNGGQLLRVTTRGFFGFGNSKSRTPDIVQAGDPVLHEPTRDVPLEVIFYLPLAYSSHYLSQFRANQGANCHSELLLYFLDQRIQSDEIQRVIDDMIAAMRAAPGVGLSANQIGVPLRVRVPATRWECKEERTYPQRGTGFETYQQCTAMLRLFS